MRLNYSVVFIILIASCSFSPEETDGEEPVPVTVYIAENYEFRYKVSASGYLEHKKTYSLAFKTGGIIRSVNVSEGDLVKKGEMLASLDLSEVESHERKAEVALEKAGTDLERISRLHKDGAATREQLDNAGTAYEIAKSDLQIARFNLIHSTLHSPVRGTVLKVLQDEHEMVPAGNPVIILGCEEEKLVLKLHVTDRQRVLLQQGDPAVVFFDAHPGREFKSEISKMAPVADPYSGMFELILEFITPEIPVVSGLLGRAEISGADSENYVSVPVDALAEAAGNRGIIYTVINGRAKRTNISIFRIHEGRLLVSDGISPGDTIVVEGSSFTSNNDTLNVLNL